MSNTIDDHNATEPVRESAPAWWREIFDVDTPRGGVAPDEPAAELFPEITFEEAPDLDSSAIPIDARTRQGGSPRHQTTYTLEKADAILDALRALPAKDPSQRRLDKQAVIRHLVDEITALQKRGYALEEIAAVLTCKSVEITCATLKSYLQRSRRAARGGGRKSRSRAELPLVLRGRIRG